MKPKTLLMVILFAILTVVSWCLAIRNLELRDRQMKEARFRLRMNVALYLTLQTGNVKKVQDNLGMIILGLTRDFERTYGVPRGTNSFATQFAHAQAIAAQVETNLVSISSIFPEAEVNVVPAQ